MSREPRSGPSCRLRAIFDIVTSGQRSTDVEMTWTQIVGNGMSVRQPVVRLPYVYSATVSARSGSL